MLASVCSLFSQAQKPGSHVTVSEVGKALGYVHVLLTHFIVRHFNAVKVNCALRKANEMLLNKTTDLVSELASQQEQVLHLEESTCHLFV